VRKIVGGLVAAGVGDFSLKKLKEVLESKVGASNCD
jgi:hypothetical protein